ncbi:MAG: hypothetical protein PUC29_00555 [Clostridia bacterium]|nr:hypothetical protein [Clostridia bacterium]
MQKHTNNGGEAAAKKRSMAPLLSLKKTTVFGGEAAAICQPLKKGCRREITCDSPFNQSAPKIIFLK